MVSRLWNRATRSDTTNFTLPPNQRFGCSLGVRAPCIITRSEDLLDLMTASLHDVLRVGPNQLQDCRNALNRVCHLLSLESQTSGARIALGQPGIRKPNFGPADHNQGRSSPADAAVAFQQRPPLIRRRK